MSDWFGAQSGSKSSNISTNPVGQSTSPPVAGPISTTGGAQHLGSATLTIGSSGYGPGGATANKGGKSGDLTSSGKHTTGSMGPRLP